MRVDSLNWNPLFSGKQYPCFQELAAQAHFLDQAWVTESEVIVTSEEEPGLRAASGLFLLVKVLGELFVLPSMS